MKYTGYIAVAFIIIAGGWWLLGTDRGQSIVMSDSPADSMGEMADDMSLQSDESQAGGGTNIAASMSMMAAPNVIIEVSGKNFEFSKKEIRVKEGDIVQIDFTSESGMHDWVVDAFDARTEVLQTGGTSSVTFVADKKGSFEYYCSVGQHRANGMVGTLIVE